MKERIQKILSAHGVASRRKAEELILAGRVTCNGMICSIGDTADIAIDTILLDGQPLPSKSEYIYLMLNKPRGYVTTLSDEKGRKNAAMLVADCGTRVYPVGRLDMDSEGLLLFTNDGDFANCLMHPSHEVKKTYRVVVDGYHDKTPELLRRPILLDGYQISPPEIDVVRVDNGRALIDVVIHEGRNRQVRRMCAAAGLQVRRLIRISEGDLRLGDLPPGKWRHLTKQEVNALLNGGNARREEV